MKTLAANETQGCRCRRIAVGKTWAIVNMVVTTALASMSPVVTPAAAQASEKPSTAEANYRELQRVYETLHFEPWTVMVEQQLMTDDPALAKKSLARLESKLRVLDATLPKTALPNLHKTTIFLMYGSKANRGGRANGASYYQKNAPEFQKNIDLRWRNCVVIKSAQNYANLSELWSVKVLMHEFAHAFQLQQWPEKQPDICEAWDHAMKQGLYRNVKDDKGKTLDRGYATTNQLEYFAELSCMYFVGCNYRPFNREELKGYDPVGYAMIEKLWRVGASSPLTGKAEDVRGSGALTPREEPVEQADVAALKDLPLGFTIRDSSFLELVRTYLRTNDHVVVPARQVELIHKIPTAVTKVLFLPSRRELLETEAYQKAIKAADMLSTDDTRGVEEAKYLRQIADRHGKKTVLGPTGRDAERVAKEMAPFGDVFVIQAQRWLQEDTSRELKPFCDNVHRIAAAIRAGNPKAIIWVQVGRRMERGGGNAGLFFHAYARLKATHPEDLQAMHPFIAAMNARPEHGMAALKQFLRDLRPAR